MFKIEYYKKGKLVIKLIADVDKFIKKHNLREYYLDGIYYLEV